MLPRNGRDSTARGGGRSAAFALDQAAPHAMGAEPRVITEGKLEALRADRTRMAHGDGVRRFCTRLCRVVGNGKPLVRIDRTTRAASMPVHQRGELAVAHFARAACLAWAACLARAACLAWAA